MALVFSEVRLSSGLIEPEPGSSGGRTFVQYSATSESVPIRFSSDTVPPLFFAHTRGLLPVRLPTGISRLTFAAAYFVIPSINSAIKGETKARE